MNLFTLDIPQMPYESLRALNRLFPRFKEKEFHFDLVTPRPDRTIVWFVRRHDRRRYALTVGEKGFLRLRRYDSDDTRQMVFELKDYQPADFDDLLDAFEKSESDWIGYALEIRPGVWV